MPAELMERPRRGTGRTRSRAGRREKGIPPPPAPGTRRTRGGAAGDPRGDLGPPDARLERSRAHPERSPGRAGAGSGAGIPSPRGYTARPCRRDRRDGGGELPFQCRLLTERH